MTLIYYFPDFFKWWYGQGVKDCSRFLRALFSYLYNFFSIKSIFKTFFSPWKRMVETRQRGLQGFADWIIDNMVSRGVAMVMRIILLFIFAFVMFALIIVTAVIVAAWILMPILPFVALVMVVA